VGWGMPPSASVVRRGANPGEVDADEESRSAHGPYLGIR